MTHSTLHPTVRESLREAMGIRAGHPRKYQAEKWVTIGAHEGEGGTPVRLDGQGSITAGPSGLAGKSIDQLDRGVKGTDKDRRGHNLKGSVNPPEPEKPKESPPKHLSHSGPVTEFGQSVWRQIRRRKIYGAGADHAAKGCVAIGKLVASEVDRRVGKSHAAAIKKAEKQIAAADRAVGEIERRPSANRDEFEQKKAELARAKETLGIAVSRREEARQAVNREMARATREALAEVRDFGGKLPEIVSTENERVTREIVGILESGAKSLPADWMGSVRSAFQRFHVHQYSRAYFRQEMSRGIFAMQPQGSDSSPIESIAAHEMTHAAEAAIPDLAAVGVAYREQRVRATKNPSGQNLEPIYPDHEDPEVREEVGYRDELPTHYCGKVYPRNAGSEIITMGIEGVLHGQHGINEDADYRHFILGLLAGF